MNLELGEDAFGSLKSSTGIIRDPKMLRERLLEEGYLYLQGFLDRDAVLRARDSITKRLGAEGLLHPDYPAFEGVAKPKERTAFRPDLAFGNSAIENLIYGPKVTEFYRTLLGGQYVTMISPGSDRLAQARVLLRIAISSTWGAAPSRSLLCGCRTATSPLNLVD